MKTIEAVDIYNLLLNAKLSNIPGKAQISFLKIMKALRHVSEEYKKDLEEAKEKLKDDRFEEMVSKMKRCAETENSIRTKANKEGVSFDSLLSDEQLKDVHDVNAYFNEYETKFKAYREEIDNELQEVPYEKINEDDFSIFLESNDIEMSKKLLLQEYLSM